MTTTRSAILVVPQTQKITGEKISGFERKSFTRHNSPDSKVFGFKVPTLIPIQNLRRHDQTGEFLFRIRPLVCKRQNQSDIKTFRIPHESGTISSSVNLYSVDELYQLYYNNLVPRAQSFKSCYYLKPPERIRVF